MDIDEGASLGDMRNAEWAFFKHPFGKREEHIVHRGCLIVRFSADDRDYKPKRRTSVYLFGLSSESKKKITFNVDAGVSGIDSIDAGRGLIDRILNQGWYNYGLKEPQAAS